MTDRCPLCPTGTFSKITGACGSCLLPVANWPAVQALKDRIEELEAENLEWRQKWESLRQRNDRRLDRIAELVQENVERERLLTNLLEVIESLRCVRPGFRDAGYTETDHGYVVACDEIAAVIKKLQSEHRPGEEATLDELQNYRSPLAVKLKGE